MTTNKTTELIFKKAFLTLTSKSIQHGYLVNTYRDGVNLEKCHPNIAAAVEALAAFGQANLVKKQYDNIGKVNIPKREDMGFDEQSAVRKLSVDEVLAGCQDEGCPHYHTAIKCESRDGGCLATVPQQLIVREMTVDDIAKETAESLWRRAYPNGGSIYKKWDDLPLEDKEHYIADVSQVAKALAKLGAIRVVEGKA